MNPPLRGPRLVAAAVALTLALGGCGKPADCPRCETLVIAALGEPDHLLSPFVWQSVGRDIGDLVYERLAILDPVRAPLDSTAYRAGLAERWERVDSLTWLFHLRPDARWQDGVAVTASDVVFSFEAHQDSALDAANRAALSDLRATTEDDRTVRIAFQSYRPDQLYDATSHVRVFPRHVWDSVPRDRWGASADPARLTGSGPYRVAEWRRGQLLTLEAVSASAPIRRITWQFAQGPDALTNLVLSGDVDLVETLPDQARLAEVSRAPHLKVISYPSAVYGFLGFNFARRGGWNDVRVRRALTLGLDRETLVRAIFGPGTAVPNGPLSAQLWLWETPPGAEGDSAAAVRLLDSAGWTPGRDGLRRQQSRSLTVDILVPGTSAPRRSLATAIQERWRRLGVQATVTVVDFPVFQERLGQGRFDTYIGSWLDEPHPRSLTDQWTRGGWGNLNYGKYASPAFDSVFALAVSEADSARARSYWRTALQTLNADAPAIWLFNPRNNAVVHRRVGADRFPPFAWLSDLPGWALADPASVQSRQ
ncbi:MAG TPA: peptide ABC transporter substrate-binding protein [Gemmatimonadales bacterium]